MATTAWAAEPGCWNRLDTARRQLTSALSTIPHVRREREGDDRRLILDYREATDPFVVMVRVSLTRRQWADDTDGAVEWRHISSPGDSIYRRIHGVEGEITILGSKIPSTALRGIFDAYFKPAVDDCLRQLD
jgi:hypothetical protein